MKALLVCTLTVILIFVFLFPRNLAPELTVKPQWVSELIPGMAAVTDERAVAVRMGDLFGYVDVNGAVQHADRAYYGVTMSDSAFINYSSVNQNLVVRDTTGRITESVPARGYPLYLSNRLFNLVTDRTGVSELDSDGNTLWSLSFSSVVVDVDATSAAPIPGANDGDGADADSAQTNGEVEEAPGLTVIGLLDGRVVLVDSTGNIVYEHHITGSSYDALFGCSITADGTRIGAVAGLQPQRLVMFEKRNGSFDVVSDENLNTETRAYVHTMFSDDGELLIASQKDHLFVMSRAQRSPVTIPLPGETRAVASHPDGSIYAFSDENGKVWLSRYASPGTLLFSTETAAEEIFLDPRTDGLWIGIDSMVAKYVLEAQ